MANLKTLLPQIIVPPITNTVLGANQQISATGSYYINGNFSITLPPASSFSLGDIITITSRLGATTAEIVGDSTTDILTKLGTTDKIIFNENISVKLTHNDTNWEI